jgi:DNA-binding transcriptional regulator YiaG
MIGPSGFMQSPKLTDQDRTMTGTEFKSTLKRLKLTQGQFAERFGRNKSTVSDWVQGHAPVPTWVAEILKELEVKNS